jgi:hypothetical protein
LQCALVQSQCWRWVRTKHEAEFKLGDSPRAHLGRCSLGGAG